MWALTGLFFFPDWLMLKFFLIHSLAFLEPSAGQWRLMHFYCTTSCEPPSKAQNDVRACKKNPTETRVIKAIGFSHIQQQSLKAVLFVNWMGRISHYEYLFFYTVKFDLFCNSEIDPAVKVVLLQIKWNLVWMLMAVSQSVLLSCLTWGCIPVLLPAPVEKHHGVPIWMSEVCFCKDKSYKKIKHNFFEMLHFCRLSFFCLYFSSLVRLNWPHRLHVSQRDGSPRAALQARGHGCYQEQHLVVMGTRARGRLTSVLLCHWSLWVCLWPMASSYV